MRALHLSNEPVKQPIQQKKKNACNAIRSRELNPNAPLFVLPQSNKYVKHRKRAKALAEGFILPATPYKASEYHLADTAHMKIDDSDQDPATVVKVVVWSVVDGGVVGVLPTTLLKAGLKNPITESECDWKV
uniref:TsaA-like domain-containing protein n=1 Tax=Steinernema glaseri TaxID=37863 RepID=A0A1I8A5X6_9BILA